MPVEIVIPNVGESVTNGVIAAWTAKDGQWVERDQTVLELETDKITMEVPAPAAGVITHAAAEGDTVDVGAVVGMIDDAAPKPAGASAGAAKQAAEGGPATATAAPPKTSAPAPAAPQSAPAAPSANGHAVGDARATPLARKVAGELGVDLATVQGTGAGHRIREQDVRAATSNGAAIAPHRGVRVERMSPLRQRLASRLVEAQQTAAMLTTFNEVDMTEVMALRKQYKDAFTERHGVGLGFMSFFVKAAVAGLRQFPLINAFIVEDEQGKPAIEHHDYYDVAIAVSSPKGLVVPVLRDCDRLSFAGIELGIKDLGTRARDGKLALDELMGGTFTITNGGIFGSMMSTPILNPPQSAILGMHAIKNRAVEDPGNPGQIALRPMMYLALSYDHRIVDGAEAVSFLVAIKNAIENPSRLMLEV